MGVDKGTSNIDHPSIKAKLAIYISYKVWFLQCTIDIVIRESAIFPFHWLTSLDFSGPIINILSLIGYHIVCNYIFPPGRTEMGRLIQDLSCKMQEQLEFQKSSSTEGKERDGQTVQRYRTRLSEIESELSTEKALHQITQNSLRSLEEDCQRLRHQLHSVRRRDAATPDKWVALCQHFSALGIHVNIDSILIWYKSTIFVVFILGLLIIKTPNMLLCRYQSNHYSNKTNKLGLPYYILRMHLLRKKWTKHLHMWYY